MRTTVLLCVLLAWPASHAYAQVTLVVRDTPDAHPQIERSVEEALREAVGGSVRRIASPLDELALAAGCTSASDTDPACLATIARAGDARLVAIEHLTPDGDAWHAQVDLRRADGTQVSVMRSRCDATACVAESAVDTSPAVPVHRTDATREPVTTPSVAPIATPAPAPLPRESAPAPREMSIPVVPTVLFASSLLVGVGSLVAAGFTSSAANDATHLGVLRYATQVDQERAYEEQANIALGVGIALASAGAGLAIAGLITLAGREGPRLRIGVLDVGLSMSF